MSISHLDNFETNATSAISAGATTSPLNDIPSIAAPFYLAFDAENVNGHYEIVYITSKTATNVNHSALTYAHSTDEKIRVVVPAVEFDNFQTKDGGDGWIDSESATFVSQDEATGVFNIASDVTGKYSKGMRYKYTQAQALSHYWSFNSSSTPDVGSATMTNIGTPTYTAGKFSNALTLDGSTDALAITDATAFKPTGDFTIGCWVKKTSAGTEETIWQSYSQNTAVAGIRLEISATNLLRFTLGKNTGTTENTDYIFVHGVTNVADNAMHYIVVSYKNNFVQIYVDGKLENSAWCFTPVYAATNYVRIGCRNLTGTNASFLNGQIDDFFIINGYALGENTIKAKYDAGTAQGTGSITVQKYGIITNVGAYSGGNTPITIWGGQDYSLINATISSPYYSTQKTPFGFNTDKEKWKVETTVNYSTLTGSPVTSTWYNSISCSIPIGNWVVSYAGGFLAATSSSGSVRAYTTLATITSGTTDILNTRGIGTQSQSATTQDIYSVVYFERIFNLSAKTIYYLNYSYTGTVAGSNVGFAGALQPTTIKVICGYL